MLEFKDRSALAIREFGNDEMRKLRHVIETTDPHMIHQDERYLKIMQKMNKQKDINNSQHLAKQRALLKNLQAKPESTTYKRPNSIAFFAEDKNKKLIQE